MERRTWTPAKKRAVLNYYRTHSNAETIAHYKISSGQLHVWKKEAQDPTLAKRAFGNFVKKEKASKANGLGRVVLARRLRKEIMRHIGETAEISDIELNALLLIKEILN